MKRFRIMLAAAIAAGAIVMASPAPASAQEICVDLHIGIGGIGWNPPPICLPPA